MAALWMKFPDEVLFANHFKEEEKAALEAVFSVDNEDSAWRQALDILHLQNPEGTENMLYWFEGAPYFNWSAYAQIVSGGMMQPVKDEEAGYKVVSRSGVKLFWALLKTQWHISRFLAQKHEGLEPLVESLALGIALQASIMRLSDGQEHMAQWLSNIDKAPKQHHAVLKQIQSIQVRRTEISECWHEVFSPSQEEIQRLDEMPEFFWDDDVPQLSKPKECVSAATQKSEWQGRSVFAGSMTGLAAAVRPNVSPEELKALKAEYNAPLILVFKNARPETVELFSYADAVIFGTGGVLCHACTIAREMQMPSVTALGTDIFDQIRNEQDKVWLHVDGQSGHVSMIEK
jgi:phosphohistidine swiveling domain-containing protein